MLDDKDEFVKNGFVWVWSLDGYSICMYPDSDVEASGRKRATPEEVHDGGYRLKEGYNPSDPMSWTHNWRLKVVGR